MKDNDKAIQELFTRLEQLSRQQRDFQGEIQKLQQQLQQLKTGAAGPDPAPQPAPVESAQPKVTAEPAATSQARQRQHITREVTKAPWEEFIGTNLLNKVGIAVLVLGIAFGVKYSIDRELLNDLTRTILGYSAGMALVAVAMRPLKIFGTPRMQMRYGMR